MNGSAFGLMGLVAADPLRSSIAVIALLILIAILRCLRHLAFFPDRHRKSQPNKPSRR